MTYVHLTAPTGNLVMVKADQIVSLRSPLVGEMSPGARTVIVLVNGAFQAVKETPKEVEAKLA